MNTTELVRLVERARPRSNSSRTAAPLFFTELIGPARQAILRARQLLLSEQQGNGSWQGVQTGDASLPSQLVLWLAYVGEAQGELAQKAAAAIFDRQLPSGGWSLQPNGPPDVSTSVQAYFALKLSGVEPSDERLNRARRVIRRLGGADAADATTRYWLALLGQIDYDCCASCLPERLLFGGSRARIRAATSIVWSHRPVQDVGMERGVRELFVDRPSHWPKLGSTRASGPWRKALSAMRTATESVIRRCEHRGWTPLRRRGLERAEAALLEAVQASRIEQLDFFELLWHAVAVRTIGYAEHSPELRTCEKRLRAMVAVDEDGQRAKPRLRALCVSDTALMLRALTSSGVSLCHPAILAAFGWLAQSRRARLPFALVDLANFMMVTKGQSNEETKGGLPPGIEVARETWDEVDGARSDKSRIMRRVALKLGKYLRSQLALASTDAGALLEAIATSDSEDSAGAETEIAVERLRAAQCADGGWDNGPASDRIRATSLAVCGLAAAGANGDDRAVAAGINWLLVQQRASGGWGGMMNCEPRGKNIAGPTASQTAFALLALVAAGRANDRAARRAVQFLVETQEDDGRWREPHFVVRDDATSRWFGNDLHSVAWPLLALSQWAVAGTNESGDDESASLRLVSGPVDN